MPQLALNQRQRDPLMQQLDRVSVPELVGREPAPHACLERELAQLDPCSAGRPRPSPGRAVDHAEQRTDRKLQAVSEPWVDR